MIEKVNPSHPDKLADRIAGALVDLAYEKSNNPKIAVEVLLGHGDVKVIIESSENFSYWEVLAICKRITESAFIDLDLRLVEQDKNLSRNQVGTIRCGDNGIFKGVPLREEDHKISEIARAIYRMFPSDGKYILDGDRLVICQSKASRGMLNTAFPGAYINPIGDWSGGMDVDSGATNRKLGSDMAMSVTGGGLHGKDLSKADVSVNIYAFLKAQSTGEVVELSCAIGDEEVDGLPYGEIVEIARNYIDKIGGFEKFAEWGLY